MEIAHADKSSFRKIENPYIVGNPIKSKELFFGWQDEFRFIRDNIAGQKGTKVILLKGGRRSGKTSMLRQIEQGNRDIAEAVFCDFHQMAPQIEKDEDVPFQIGNAILAVDTFHEFRDSFMNDSGTWTAKLGRLIGACLKKISPKILILLWDEYEVFTERFCTETISEAAFGWIYDVKNEMVYFILTGSRQIKYFFPESDFSPEENVQTLDINLLTENGAKDLIRKPVEGFLEYSDEVVRRIYRFSGGHPFYVQYICQLLVNHINSVTHRNHVEAADLDDVIKFIILNPAGHIQETWRSLKDEEKLTLMALAHTIQDSNSYTNWADVLKTAKNLRLPLSNKSAIRRLKGKYMVDMQNDEKVRFQIDIFRKWIASEFQIFKEKPGICEGILENIRRLISGRK